MIAESMVKDFVLLKKLAGLVNIVADLDEGDQAIDLLTVIEEIEKVSMQELDFRIEAENTKFFKENCIEDEEVRKENYQTLLRQARLVEDFKQLSGINQ